VSSLALIAVCSFALGATEADNYAEAHQQTMKTGRPMLVMVSTDWCAPCQMMKKTVIPQVRQRGVLGRVSFAVVNPDQDRDLAEQLTGGGPVPQLVLYRKTSHGWLRRKLVGGQSVEEVEKFIDQGLAADHDKDGSTAKTEPSDKKADKDLKKGPTA
jgi:thioredoxin-like negative regulator of GroEL